MQRLAAAAGHFSHHQAGPAELLALGKVSKSSFPHRGRVEAERKPQLLLSSGADDGSGCARKSLRWRHRPRFGRTVFTVTVAGETVDVSVARDEFMK